MIRVVLTLFALLWAAAAPAETLVTGLSQDKVSITANFDGSNILVFGAVKRDAPLPPGPKPQVVMTLEGPSQPLVIRKKAWRYGIWVNSDAVHIDAAPTFYAVATSAPLRQVLSNTDDLRYHVSIPLAIRSIGAATMTNDPKAFIDALIDLRKKSGAYELEEGKVSFRDSTLFSTRIAMPANLTEGAYKLRIFLTRGGKVLDHSTAVIEVRKAGLERWLFNLSLDRPALYGLLSLFIAISAGWLASAAFQILRR